MPDWLETALRASLAVVYLFLLAKMIGKRQVSQLTFFEYVVGITIGSLTAQAALVGGVDTLINSMVALLVFALFSLGSAYFSMKNKVFRNIFEGKSTVLVKDGKIMERNLKKERLTIDDLMEQLRMKNAFKLADVEFALMEPNGRVSVLKKTDKQPLNASQIGLDVRRESEPQVVVMDGEIMDEGLATIGFNRHWLHGELGKQGVTLENVFFAQVDSQGKLNLDLYDDKIQMAQPSNLKLTHATLKKCQADLELFALSTKNERMKQLYGEEAQRMQELLEEITPWLNPDAAKKMQKGLDALP